MNNLFNDDYYERGLEKGLSCYSNYRWIPELTIPMCVDMISYLHIGAKHTVLDYGCAKGYAVKAMRLLHLEAYGVDISEYAINSAPKEVSEYLYLINEMDEIPLANNSKYDWTIAKDVLEHVPYAAIVDTISKIRQATKNLFAIVPLGENGKYIVPAYELDVTHHIREPLSWWEKTFEDCGFKIQSSTYRAGYIKSNWSAWDKGNGFLILGE
jgi:SAM-dependent methyltransferase